MKFRPESENINTNSSRLADIVRIVFENTATEYGHEYFRQMVLHLAKCLAADYAFIGELDKSNSNIIKTLAFIEKGKIVKNISYQLQHTPCENVVNKVPSFYPTNVANLFPKNTFLNENGIEAYLGIPLFNSKKEPIGLICCMFKDVVKYPELVEDVIQVFSSRISTEIERVNLEEKLRKSENRFRHIAKNMNAWIWEIDPHGKYVYTSQKIKDILGYHPAELVGKRYFHEFYSGTNLEDNKAYLYDLFQEKKILNGLENQKRNKNGETVWIKTYGGPMISPNGEFQGYRGTSIDITEQKNTELHIQNQNEFLRTVLNSLNYPFHIVNIKDFTISHSNDSSSHLNDTNKLTCYQVSHNREFPCCETEHSCPLQIAVKSRNSCIVEHDHTNEYSVKYPCEIHCHPIFDKEGNVSQVIKYSIDKTEREHANWTIAQRVKELQCIHQISQALEKHKNHPDNNYNNLINVIPTGFQHTEITGCSILIYGTEYKTKNFCSSLWKLESPLYNGTKLVGKVRVCFNQKTNTNPFLKEEQELLETISQQLSVFIKQQHNKKLQDVIYKISEATNTTKNLHDLIGIIHHQLKSLIDASNFYVALYDEKNKRFTIPYSIDKKVDLFSFPAGKSLTQYVLQNKKPKLITREILDELEKSGEVVSVGQRSKVWLGVPMIIKGKAFGVLSVQSYHDEIMYDHKDLEILEFISNQISISVQRKMAEDDLKSALLKAQESDQLKTTFLSVISHELRTPLNAIIGFSELITTESNNKETRNFASLINQSGYDLLGIIDNILNITQLEDNSIKINKNKFQVKDLCTSLLDKTQNEQRNAKNKQLTFNFRPSPAYLEISIETDKDKLFKILYNLLNNAVKFTQEGEIELSYLVENKEDIPHVKFTVKDSGIGISPDKQDIIFKLFRQEDDTQSRKFEGTGIGLSVAKKFTELLNGYIEVQSELGKGSKFSVWIPIEPCYSTSN